MKRLTHVTFVLALLAVSGCGGPDEATRVANAEPDAKVTVADLLKAYTDDFGAADQKYKRKVIVVDGYVEDVTDDDELRSIHLDGEQGEAEDLTAPLVSCDFESAATMPKVKKGDRVQIKGLCEGKMAGMISLGYCVAAE